MYDKKIKYTSYLINEINTFSRNIREFGIISLALPEVKFLRKKETDSSAMHES